MNFFGMKATSSTPTNNALPSDISKWPVQRQWRTFSEVVGRIIDRYVIVDEFYSIRRQSKSQKSSSLKENPHTSRISIEHAYFSAPMQPTSTASEPTPKSRRHLPTWLKSSSDRPHASSDVHKASPDRVFNYASAVLNDGLLPLEFQDAMHEGDGPKIVRCWKFLLLYFRFAGHTKYAQEALHLQFVQNGAASPHVAKQLLWGRVVSTHSGKGHNLPIDLHMEHLNRCVKDYIIGLGPNAKEETITHISASHSMVF